MPIQTSPVPGQRGDAIERRLKSRGTPAPPATLGAAVKPDLAVRDIVGRKPKFQLPPTPTGPKRN